MFCSGLPDSDMQDYPELSKFKDALRQAAETITAVRTVFSDASANSGQCKPFLSMSKRYRYCTNVHRNRCRRICISANANLPADVYISQVQPLGCTVPWGCKNFHLCIQPQSKFTVPNQHRLKLLRFAPVVCHAVRLIPQGPVLLNASCKLLHEPFPAG